MARIPYEELVGRINEALHLRVMAVLVQQGRVNVEHERQIAEMQQRIAKLEEQLYLLAYNLHDGLTRE